MDSKSSRGGSGDGSEPPPGLAEHAGGAIVAFEPAKTGASCRSTPLDGLPAERLRVLLIEDEPEEAALAIRLLARATGTEYEVEHVTTAEDALERLTTRRFDVCLVDLYLPGRDGLAFLRALQARHPEIPAILLSGYAEEQIERTAIAFGAADFLDKEELDTARLDRCLRFAVARAQVMERLGRLARFDELTGLANRALFHDRLEKALAAARRHRCHLAVILLDLNGFKAVNDSLGHRSGDALLCRVGERLRETLRQTDTVARLGGDEFAMIIEDLRHREDAVLVARKLLDAIAPAFEIDGEAVAVSASLGVALYPGDADEPEALLARADAAMYRAKREGGNLCRFHDPRLERQLGRGPILVDALGEAIRTEALELLFQPQVTLRPGPIGLASIVRWSHPEHEIVEADSFRSLAERAGLIQELTDWLIASACRQARHWMDQGFGPLHVAVPIYSRRQLAWSGLAEQMREHSRQQGVPPGAIELEIAEPLLLEELEAGGAAFPPLRACGVRIAVAGYGLGATSLMVLRDAPIHTVKLSRELIRGTPEDRRRTLFVASVIDLAHSLDLRLVAEGIDNKAQLQMLRRAGCDAVQSLLSCPPLPEQDAAIWLQRAQRRQHRR